MFMQLFRPACLQNTCIMRSVFYIFVLLFPRVYPDHGFGRLLVFWTGHILRFQHLNLFMEIRTNICISEVVFAQNVRCNGQCDTRFDSVKRLSQLLRRASFQDLSVQPKLRDIFTI